MLLCMNETNNFIPEQNYNNEFRIKKAKTRSKCQLFKPVACVPTRSHAVLSKPKNKVTVSLYFTLFNNNLISNNLTTWFRFVRLQYNLQI